MGYESQLIIGRRTHFADKEGRDFCDKIMTINLCKMGHRNFSNPSRLFNKEIDFNLYMDDGNTLYDEDDYGCKCYYAPIKSVIRCLEKLAKENEYYRRTDLALKALKAFKSKDWCWKAADGSYSELVVIHYGY